MIWQGCFVFPIKKEIFVLALGYKRFRLCCPGAIYYTAAGLDVDAKAGIDLNKKLPINNEM